MTTKASSSSSPPSENVLFTFQLLHQNANESSLLLDATLWKSDPDLGMSMSGGFPFQLGNSDVGWSRIHGGSCRVKGTTAARTGDGRDASPRGEDMRMWRWKWVFQGVKRDETEVSLLFICFLLVHFFYCWSWLVHVLPTQKVSNFEVHTVSG